MSTAVPGSHYIDVASLPWEPTGVPGVEMKVLWREPQGEAFTALFRSAPGTKIPTHQHVGFEQTYVLQGSLVDDDGACTAGNFVWRDPGSVHSAHSPDGCLTIGIFQKANRFYDETEAS
ncbi:MAG: cupin domain-containing protein [Planctomycetales bacterium]